MFDPDGYQHIFHCAKCGAESETRFVLGLAGYGRVCFDCYSKGNKDDGKKKRVKMIQKQVAQRTARREIEGRGLERFV